MLKYPLIKVPLYKKQNKLVPWVPLKRGLYEKRKDKRREENQENADDEAG